VNRHVYVGARRRLIKTVAAIYRPRFRSTVVIKDDALCRFKRSDRLNAPVLSVFVSFKEWSVVNTSLSFKVMV
jgi:hypothetical protein